MRQVLFVTVVLVGMLFLQIPTLHAQATPPSDNKNVQASLDKDVSLLRQDIQSQKKQLIAANLELTDTEATKFWPVYDQYTAESSKIGDQKYALIKEYAAGFGKLTDDQALSLAKRALALDEQVTQLRSKYLPIIGKVLPGAKTATFFQMDRRVGALIDLRLAAEIPFVQDQN
ncbi:MAG TPA: hypothetical protein VMG82_28815 [Candidatus Sulfotelmatobacter sp.]|nr:hypothetical protein [Candidatus Sulfotelmatobacter sp.]